MKAFDIELAKQGHPVCTRGGQKARIICFDRKKKNYPIVACVEEEGAEEVYNFCKDGSFLLNCDTTSRDLMMAPLIREGWANVFYNDNDERIMGKKIYSTEQEAIDDAKTIVDYIATIPVKWEE